MRLIPGIGLSLALLAGSAIAVTPAAQTSASFDLRVRRDDAGRAPIDLVMRLAYRGAKGDRITGFRTLRDQSLERISFSGDGVESVAFEYLESQTGATLSWSGILGASGVGAVTAKAVLQHGLIGRDTVNAMPLGWLGDWPMGVEDLTLRLTLPPGFSPAKLSANGDFARFDKSGDEANGIVAVWDLGQLGPGDQLSGQLTVVPGLTSDYGAWRMHPRDVVIFLSLMSMIVVPAGIMLLRALLFSRSHPSRTATPPSIDLIIQASRTRQNDKDREKKPPEDPSPPGPET